jgi:microcompartment protein CcmL/EutN
MSADAVSLIELDSVATGLFVLDAMVKQAEITVLEANLIEPGHFLILVEGSVAPVQEAHKRAQEVAGPAILHSLVLPWAHDALLPAISGVEDHDLTIDTLGIVEGHNVVSTVKAADQALKESEVSLAALRLQGGLGGRGFFVVHGVQHDVEAAITAATDCMAPYGGAFRTQIIPVPHPEMLAWLLRPSPFSTKPSLPTKEP